MRRTTISLLAVGAFVASGCGSGTGSFANHPRPPVPVDLTVYISNSRVSVSPNAVGAGPVVFIVTNNASSSQSLTILPADVLAGQPLANTGPINPQGTAEVKVNFTQPGAYTVSTSNGASTNVTGSTGATLSTSGSIQAATVYIGSPRPTGSNQLLLP